MGEQEGSRMGPGAGASGLVHVYTGDGKGKTTAAFGLAMRAVGRGWRVLIIQFLKARESGEVLAAERLRPELEVRRFGTERFIDPRHPREEDLAVLRAGLEEAKRALASGDYRLVVLDEINVVAHMGLIGEDEVLKTVRSRAEGVEVVLTGRYAPKSFIDAADYVTEFREVKHPFRKGVQAREGIEF